MSDHVSTVVSQQDRCGFRTCKLVLRGVSEFYCTASPMARSLGLTGNSKLPVGVNMSVNGCLCPCVSPVIDCRPVQCVPPTLAKCQLGTTSSSPATQRQAGIANGWMIIFRWSSVHITFAINLLHISQLLSYCHQLFILLIHNLSVA